MALKNPIKAAYEEFRDNVFEHQGDNPLVMDDVRAGFYSGAAFAFSVIVWANAPDADKKALQQLALAFADDLASFRREIIEAAKPERLQ